MGRNNLLDFLQGASNAAASNVSAPVDGIAWLLRKAGVNVGTPIGGSDWMAQRGLTVEPQNKLAGILGESFGGVAPMLAAAKAPQIAKGLLQGAENLAAPRTLNPQTGAVVWHGSPHKFDKFDASKIGTGEGAQAYGHGLYLAESPSVAQQYKAALSGPDTTMVGGKALAETGLSSDAQSFVNQAAAKVSRGGKLETEIANLEALANSGHPSAPQMQEAVNALRGGVDRGQLYKVDLPDEHIAKMLDWDKPISQQHPDVQKALQSPQVTSMVEKLKKSGQLGNYSADELAKFRGEDWHDFIRQASGDSNIAPSEFLRQQGIPGIRYLDGGSRGTGAGTSNFVVFPGNEDILSIMERNGQPVLNKLLGK